MSEADQLTVYRVTQLEAAVETMARAASKQADFNIEVETFMASARTWGKIGMVAYGTGQSLLVGVILYGVHRIGG